MLKYPCLVLDHDDTVVQSEATVNYPFFVEFLKEYRPGMTITQHEYISECFEPGYIEMCRRRFHFTDEELLIEYNGWKDYIRSHVPQAYPGIGHIIRRFKELGGQIVTIGSDAHRTDRIGQYSFQACEILKEIFGYVCTFENRNPIFHKL